MTKDDAYNDFENNDEDELYREDYVFEEPKIDKMLEKKESIINDEKYKTKLIPIEEEEDANESIKRAERNESLLKPISPIKENGHVSKSSLRKEPKKFENDTDKLIYEDIERKVLKNHNEVLLNPNTSSLLKKVDKFLFRWKNVQN
jgi:hypothetical protein